MDVEDFIQQGFINDRFGYKDGVVNKLHNKLMIELEKAKVLEGCHSDSNNAHVTILTRGDKKIYHFRCYLRYLSLPRDEMFRIRNRHICKFEAELSENLKDRVRSDPATKSYIEAIDVASETTIFSDNESFGFDFHLKVSFLGLNPQLSQ